MLMRVALLPTYLGLQYTTLSEGALCSQAFLQLFLELVESRVQLPCVIFAIPSWSVAQCNVLLDHVWLGAEKRLALSQKQIEAAFGQGTQRKGSLAKTTTL